MNLTKSDLVLHVREEHPDLTLAEVSEFVELAFAKMKTCLAAGEKVKLSRFGTFTVADKRARRGRNPMNGEAIMIGARRVVRFKASPALTGALNGK